MFKCQNGNKPTQNDIFQVDSRYHDVLHIMWSELCEGKVNFWILDIHHKHVVYKGLILVSPIERKKSIMRLIFLIS